MLDQLISPFLNWLEVFSTQVSVHYFVMIGAFLEELIAPIPSPFVMTLSGSMAASALKPMSILLALAVLGSFAKTIASYFIYVIADKGEDFVLGRFGKMIGISHKDVEALGKYFNKGWRDDLILFLLRAIPIVPTSPISFLAGVIKLNLRTYLVQTFLGNILRNLFYLYFGYTSLETAQNLAAGMDTAETLAKIVIVLILVVVIAWFYLQRRKENFLQKLMRRFIK